MIFDIPWKQESEKLQGYLPTKIPIPVVYIVDTYKLVIIGFPTLLGLLYLSAEAHCYCREFEALGSPANS